MKNLSIIILLIPFFYLVTACEDAELETQNIDPFVRIQFINGDSLSTLSNIVANINAEISNIDDSLNLLDSLIRLDTLNTGPDFTENIERLNNNLNELNSEKSEFDVIIDVIESGSLVVSSISSPSGISRILPGIDSLEVFRLPLDPSEDISLFDISLAGTVYDLQVAYERNTVVEQRTVIVQALDLVANSNAFDSLFLDYTDTLSNNSNDAIITAYF